MPETWILDSFSGKYLNLCLFVYIFLLNVKKKLAELEISMRIL